MQCGFLLAFVLRHGWITPYSWEGYLEFNLFLLGGDLLYLLLAEPFRSVLHRGWWKEMESCIKSAALVLFASTFFLFVLKVGGYYSRFVLIMTGGLYLGLNYVLRVSWKTYLKRHGSLRAKEAVLIASDREILKDVLDNLEAHDFEIKTVSGLILLDAQELPQEGSFFGIPVVASLHTMTEYICRNWVDEVLVVHQTSHNEERETLLKKQLDLIAISGVAVHNAVWVPSSSDYQQILEEIGGYMVLTRVVKSVTLWEALFKRTLDILGGLAGCVLALLAIVLVGPVIYLQSPGPIIFRQKRVGRNGKIFTMYKIRSMVLDADARKQELMQHNRMADGMMFKVDFDPRIIGAKRLADGTIHKGIGNYIREWSIDELPQFFNVLKGDMSLVGTRPPTLDEWQKYELYHRARMAFRPGITGMWQISGRSEITDFEEVVKLDMQYISQWTPGMDFRILLETVKTVFGKKGAM